MSEEQSRRKLAAILSADVKAYSRLMEDDEEATVRTINAHREVITGLTKQYRGRVVDAKGDNVLAEFSSVVDAVNCAVEIQRKLRERNTELPEHRKMEFRIGINLGDVIDEGDTIYGDGVNIAARLEALAEGGGICISGTAFDQVEGKLGLEFVYLGEQSVKNIKKPIRIYRVKMEGAVSGAKVKREPPLPDKPSIAVLPFVNMSDDPKQEYFCDGITEEIITGLSAIRKLFVIARNSSFTYKGKAVKVQEVSRELGVRYVLEGSVRKAGDRVRITAQLVDATTGNHLWAERYNRELKDIFAVQDEITMKIVAAMQLKLTDGDKAYLLRPKGTDNIEAYLKFLEGYHYFNLFTPDALKLARQIFEEVIALDPEYVPPYYLLGHIHIISILGAWSKNPAKSLDRAFDLAQKGLAIDECHPGPLHVLGRVYLMKKQFDEAISLMKRALELSPNHGPGHALLGTALNYAGEPERAIPYCEKGLRLDPLSPTYCLWGLAMAYRLSGRYEEAISSLKESLHHAPRAFLAHLELAACSAALGRQNEARAAVSEIVRLNPEFLIERYVESQPYKNPDHAKRFGELLRKAGLK
jgi:adenylate cyclase